MFYLEIIQLATLTVNELLAKHLIAALKSTSTRLWGGGFETNSRLLTIEFCMLLARIQCFEKSLVTRSKKKSNEIFSKFSKKNLVNQQKLRETGNISSEGKRELLSTIHKISEGSIIKTLASLDVQIKHAKFMLACSQFFLKHGKFRHLAYIYFECFCGSSKSLFIMSMYYRKCKSSGASIDSISITLEVLIFLISLTL